ncbi:MAG: MBL fold metallo-hydrolase [Actinomycetota bacterium]|nr:MBL fold metallo-hydrolase [Actinomycetota bacterium]
MRLTVIGCSGSLPGPDSSASCYLVEADGFRLVVDLGNGSLGPLQRHVNLSDVDAVLLSHLHPDHCMDLCSYYVARRYGPGGSVPRLPVHGPAGTAERMARAYGAGAGAGMPEVFDFIDVVAGDQRIGPFEVTAARMAHPVVTYGYRLTHGGAVLAYSADTGPTDTLVKLADGADLLLCEASFHDGQESVPDLHLTGGEAGAHASRAGAARLVLTHLPPWNDPDRALREAMATYDGPVEVARPGMTFDLP